MNQYATARNAFPMTQEELAIAAGISVRTVRRIENGEKVGAESIRAVRSVLGIEDHRPSQAEIDHIVSETRDLLDRLDTLKADHVPRFLGSPMRQFIPRRMLPSIWIAMLASVLVLAYGLSFVDIGPGYERPWGGLVVAFGFYATILSAGALATAFRLHRHPLLIALMGMSNMAWGMILGIQAISSATPMLLVPTGASWLLLVASFRFMNHNIHLDSLRSRRASTVGIRLSGMSS